jgi:hypothetical protein
MCALLNSNQLFTYLKVRINLSLAKIVLVKSVYSGSLCMDTHGKVREQWESTYWFIVAQGGASSQHMVSVAHIHDPDRYLPSSLNQQHGLELRLVGHHQLVVSELNLSILIISLYATLAETLCRVSSSCLYKIVS